MGGGVLLGAGSPVCLRRRLFISGPAMARGPLAPGPKGGQSSPRCRRPAGCEACCARGKPHSLRRRSDSWSSWQWGGSTGPRSAGHCCRRASWWAAPLPPLDGGGASCDCAACCCRAAAQRACRLPAWACRSEQGCCGRRRRGPGGRHSPLGMGAAAALFATRPTGRQRLSDLCL